LTRVKARVVAMGQGSDDRVRFEASVMPTPLLGVPFMDRDHAAIDKLFADAAHAPDDALMGLFDAIAQQLRDHFQREEKAMTEARVPALLTHLELHARVLREVERIRGEIVSSKPEAVREMIGSFLPQLVADHNATADAVSAAHLRA
jgi:hemerythrin-like metal-binding protein